MLKLTNDKRVIDLTVGELLELLNNFKTGLTTTEVKTMSTQSEFLSVTECAELTGYKVDYIRQLTFKRKIPFYKVGRKTKFMRAEVLEWMTSSKIDTNENRVSQYLNNNKLKIHKSPP